uniref:Putative salivary protein n=1 Tax=Ixodes scapularis TaxID=6945 RepID=Q4PMW5_IXOSC|nr:putative salivary protein [Ixodes scapularis]
MKQIFILLVAVHLSSQEDESPSVDPPPVVIQKHYGRLSPGCQTEIQYQMKQVCKVHERSHFIPSLLGCFVYCYNDRSDGMRVPLRNGLPCGNYGQICKNGECVNAPNNCEIDYFFP